MAWGEKRAGNSRSHKSCLLQRVLLEGTSEAGGIYGLGGRVQEMAVATSVVCYKVTKSPIRRNIQVMCWRIV